MEEIKKLILKNEEVDEYYKLINNFDEEVEKEVKNIIGNFLYGRKIVFWFAIFSILLFAFTLLLNL